MATVVLEPTAEKQSVAEPLSFRVQMNTEFFQKTAGKMRNTVLISVRRLNRLKRREKRILAF